MEPIIKLKIILTILFIMLLTAILGFVASMNHNQEMNEFLTKTFIVEIISGIVILIGLVWL